ncbi:TPA: hypothetical protein ACNKKM_001721 [Enterococcus faecalis]|nr:hypothetical protein [Enterococcus faecalis]
MEKKFTSVFSGAGKALSSISSVVLSMINNCSIWQVMLCASLPYILAMIVYLILWFLTEISEKRERAYAMETLRTTQSHERELAQLNMKKDTQTR